jgi:hypothetical protein
VEEVALEEVCIDHNDHMRDGCDSTQMSVAEMSATSKGAPHV